MDGSVVGAWSGSPPERVWIVGEGGGECVECDGEGIVAHGRASEDCLCGVVVQCEPASGAGDEAFVVWVAGAACCGAEGLFAKCGPSSASWSELEH